MVVCELCGRTYVYDRTRGHKATQCNSCVANKRRAERQKMMIEYGGGQCVICSYDKCDRALAFHHLDSTTKIFKLAGSYCRKWEILTAEMDKCVLLCLNCHAEVHAGMVILEA